MIRYPVAPADLEQLVDAEAPGWRDRADIRTAGFVTAGRYEEASAIWSEVKAVFMRLQHNKCAYCERRLASEDYGGAIEHDLEHFRPKSGVEAWTHAGIRFAVGPADPAGYYWLAYHLLNYAAACKKCNSPLKKNYFPVAGPRGAATADPAALNEAERPFLLYPVGQLDDDPTNVLTFLGVLAVPAKKTGPRRRRADVTVAFFELNAREELLRERAEILDSLGNHLEMINDPTTPSGQAGEARRTVERMLWPDSRHTACARALAGLYVRDTDNARKLIRAAREYLDSVTAR